MEQFNERKRQELIKKHTAEQRRKQTKQKYDQNLKNLESAKTEAKQSEAELTKFRWIDLIPFVFVGRKLQKYNQMKKAEQRQTGLNKSIREDKAKLNEQ